MLVTVTVEVKACAEMVTVFDEVGIDEQRTVEVVVSVSTVPGGGWFPKSVWHVSDGEAVAVPSETVAKALEARNARRLPTKEVYRILLAPRGGCSGKQRLGRSLSSEGSL